MQKDSLLVVVIVAHLGMGNYHEIVHVCQSVCVPVGWSVSLSVGWSVHHLRNEALPCELQLF